MAEKEERLRMTVDFPPSTTQRLKRLKDELEAGSYVDVLRSALKLLEICARVVKSGGTVEIVKEDGSRSVVKTLLIP